MELFEDFVPKPDSPLYLKINGHLKFFEYDLPRQQIQIFLEELGPEINAPDPYEYQKQYHPLTISETAYLESLRSGQRCKYVGGLLYSPIKSA